MDKEKKEMSEEETEYEIIEEEEESETEHEEKVNEPLLKFDIENGKELNIPFLF